MIKLIDADEKFLNEYKEAAKEELKAYKNDEKYFMNFFK